MRRVLGLEVAEVLGRQRVVALGQRDGIQAIEGFAGSELLTSNFAKPRAHPRKLIRRAARRCGICVGAVYSPITSWKWKVLKSLFPYGMWT